MEILGAFAMAMYVWFLSVVAAHNFKEQICIYSPLRQGLKLWVSGLVAPNIGLVVNAVGLVASCYV